MLTIFALQLCSCFGVPRRRKKPGTNMREVFQSGSLAAFKIRKAVRFKQEEDRPQLDATALPFECRSKQKCWGGPMRLFGVGIPCGHWRNCTPIIKSNFWELPFACKDLLLGFNMVWFLLSEKRWFFILTALWPLAPSDGSVWSSFLLSEKFPLLVFCCSQAVAPFITTGPRQDRNPPSV